MYEDGRVYSEKSNKFLKPDLITGYATVTMHNNGKKLREKVHRIVAKLFCDNSGEFNVVNHIDGNKLNNHYTNLEWCTQRHNNIHAIQTGLRDVSLSNSRRWLDDDFRRVGFPLRYHLLSCLGVVIVVLLIQDIVIKYFIMVSYCNVKN